MLGPLSREFWTRRNNNGEVAELVDALLWGGSVNCDVGVRVSSSSHKQTQQTKSLCGNSSVGRAQPCQGWGREFESRFPLLNTWRNRISVPSFFVSGRNHFLHCIPTPGIPQNTHSLTPPNHTYKAAYQAFVMHRQASSAQRKRPESVEINTF